MNTIKKIFISTMFIMTSLSAFAKTAMTQHVSKDDIDKINDGKIVIINSGNMKKTCIQTDNTSAMLLINTMKKLNPTFFAETIQIKPYKGNEDLIHRMKSEFLNIDKYTEIPYFSERLQKWFNLYESVTIRNQTQTGNKLTLFADVDMKPFGLFPAEIEITEYEDALIYVFTNKDNMIYDGKFKAINTNNMKIGIAVFKEGDNWILYGASGADAPNVFFLRDRINVALINRIKTFTFYFIDKVNNQKN